MNRLIKTIQWYFSTYLWVSSRRPFTIQVGWLGNSPVWLGNSLSVYIEPSFSFVVVMKNMHANFSPSAMSTLCPLLSFGMNQDNPWSAVWKPTKNSHIGLWGIIWIIFNIFLAMSNLRLAFIINWGVVTRGIDCYNDWQVKSN